MNDLPLSSILDKSARNTRCFLKTKDPDFLLATDIEYEEKRFFETSPKNSTETAPHDDMPDDISGWTEVTSKKNKRKTPTNSPELTAKTPPNHSTSIQDLQLKTRKSPMK
jgi:hypothetical protein